MNQKQPAIRLVKVGIDNFNALIKLQSYKSQYEFVADYKTTILSGVL